MKTRELAERAIKDCIAPECFTIGDVTDRVADVLHTTGAWAVFVFANEPWEMAMIRLNAFIRGWRAAELHALRLEAANG